MSARGQFGNERSKQKKIQEKAIQASSHTVSKEKRLKFAKRELQNGATMHSKIYVEDESIFQAFATSPGQWVGQDEEPPSRPTFKTNLQDQELLIH